MNGSNGAIAYIGIGGNLDEPLRQCHTALDMIGNLPETKLLRASSFYRTSPVGFSSQSDFVNAVAELRTALIPRELLHELQSIEKKMGRRETFRWGPRIIDLDILLYGQEIIAAPDLVIPHPECHRRRFVLVPCCELASYLIHPVFGVSMRGLLQRLDDAHRSQVEIIEE